MLTGPRKTISRARGLRSKMSLPEVLPWRELRKRPGGFKFRRQHPSGSYVADFYSHEARLVIEIDGIVHDMGNQPGEDQKRDKWFRNRGLKVLRIPARRILSDLENVMTEIVNTAQSSPARGGEPRSGGGV